MADYSLKEGLVEYLFAKFRYFAIPSQENNFKSKFMQSKILLYCVVLLFVLKAFTVFVSINFPSNILFADITKTALEAFANQTRQAIGLQPLKENTKLDQAAQLKAQNMVQNQYFAHTSPTGVTPWFWFSKAGYNYKYAGENLAIGFFESQEVFNAWLNSPSHKANILNPNYKEMGTAVLGGYGSNGTIVVVQEFGSESIKTAVKPATTKPVQQAKPATAEKPAEPKQEETVVVTTGAKEVLSQSIESKSSFEAPKSNIATGIASRIMNSVIYNYDGLLQTIIYGISMIVIGILLVIIFLDTNVALRRDFVFRSAVLVVILSSSVLLSRELIISIIPHQMFI